MQPRRRLALARNAKWVICSYSARVTTSGYEGIQNVTYIVKDIKLRFYFFLRFSVLLLWIRLAYKVYK